MNFARQKTESGPRRSSPSLPLLLILAALGVMVWSLTAPFSNREIGRVQALGPGLGNLTYSTDELFQPVGIVQSPRGHGNVAMVNGYLMVIYSSDGGGDSGNGGIEFWDVSDPRNPVLAVRHDNAETHGLREAHGFSFSNSYPGDYMVAQAVDGIQFWDLSNPFAISLLSYLDLPGISQGDYTGDWWVFWQAPYVYVAGTGNGLYVVDATDPTQPLLLNQLTTSQMGGLNPGMTFAAGNLLVLMENRGGNYATMDISDPANPVLLQRLAGRTGYSHIFAAGKILTSGGDGDSPEMYVHDVTHDGVVSYVGKAGSRLDNGGYGSYQDGYFHSGFSNKYAKFDIANLAQVGTGSLGMPGIDEDFGQVLGNVVFVGNDHSQGSAIIVHQTAPDTTGPEVHWIHPQDGAPDVALTGRVGVSMSDSVDIRSVNPGTFMVRPQGGLPLPGKYSVQMGLVNFTPDEPLQPNTTYEVLVEGIHDLVGNPGGIFSSQFSTTSLISSVTSGSGHTYGVSNFSAGGPVYASGTEAFTNLHPPQFSGQPYIRTAQDDAGGTGPESLTFDLSSPASVYVLFDGNASRVPAWLADGTWKISPGAVGTSGPSATRTVFQKFFSAGNVALGGNADPPAEGAGSMYSVLAVTRAGPPIPRCTINPTAKAGTNTRVDFGIGTVSGGEPITYVWDFGDGSPPTPPSNDPAVSHTYAAPGRYGVVLTARNGSGSGSCAIVQIVHNPLTPKPAVSSSTIVHDGVKSFNVNPDNNTVTAIYDSSLTRAWEVPVGRNPRTLAPAPNGDIWVVNQDDATISVLRDGDGSLLRTLSLPYASRPYGITFSPDGSAAYVTLQGTGRLLKLDPSGNIVGNIYVGPTPRGIAVSGDSRRILVTRFISRAEQGAVRVVDATPFSVAGTVNLAIDPGPDTESSGRGLPNYVGFIRISPDGQRALVPSKKDNLARGLIRDGQPLTFESRVRTIVSQIDLAQGREDLGARIDLNDRDMAQSLIFSPAGDIFFVATQGSNRIEVHDANNLTLLGGMNTGLAPQGMAFNNDASKLYVHNFMSRSVSVFDTTDYINARNNASPELVEVSTVGNEALSPQVLSGKQIFYDASNPRMSRDGYISCASCHNDGGNDGQVWDFTQAGEGLRNTIALTGKSGMGQGNVHWTANFDEIQDFENDIRNGFGGTGFLSDAEFSATADPLGAPKAGLSAELDALAAYVSSLASAPPSPYRNPDGTLTSDAQAGQQIFEARNCRSCHSGPFFTDSLRHDVGTIQASSGQGNGQPLEGTGIETPTLVGIWDTAPYMHNGQALTLHAVLTNPAHTDAQGLTSQGLTSPGLTSPGLTSPGLTSNEAKQLVAYLLQIDLPETSIMGGPPFATTDTGASFTFTSNFSSSTFECNLDGGGFSPCLSPNAYSALGEGSHTFQVRATDRAGNRDPTPANHEWTVEAIPPPEPLITNIVAGNGGSYFQDVLNVDQKPYLDRDYIFTEVPEKYVGQEMIITANEDKDASQQDFLTFDLSADATVYVLFDDRVVTLPAWLVDGTWTPAGDVIGTNDGPRRTYQKDFEAGPAELGGNAMAPMRGAVSNYNVVAVAAGSGPAGPG
jgi:DNA-binding beta-propeller fold protein YncE